MAAWLFEILVGGASCGNGLSTATSAGGGGGGHMGSAQSGGGPGGSGSGAGGALAQPGGRNGAGPPGGPGGAPGTRPGGSSGKIACAPGMTYGAPLPTTISVTQFGPPTLPPANYFAFIEGPVWIASLGTLFFSDNASSPEERIFSLMPPDVTPRLFIESSGSNGLAIDGGDKLVIADERNQRITRLDPVTGLVLDVIVPSGSFKPNDVIVRGDGNIYFTDPDSGFYRVTQGGVLTGPFKPVNRPNGIALSPDENTLYVGDSGNQQIHRFSLATDGTADPSSDVVFATTLHGAADGMCMDCAGNVYISTGGGVEVYAPSGGYLGIVPTEESSNCTFGGSDRRTIYVTSRAVLKAATLNVPGLPD